VRSTVTSTAPLTTSERHSTGALRTPTTLTRSVFEVFWGARKVERFNRILLEEWAYAGAYSSESELRACYQRFIEHYNQRMPHTALKGASPASRVTDAGLVHLNLRHRRRELRLIQPRISPARGQ
jgi:hypothetical protein